jgi:predicted phosphate transport protein (TIGR00153 family)
MTVIGKLLGKDEAFFEGFNAHAACIGDAASAFGSLFAEYADPAARHAHAQAVLKAEKLADRAAADVLQLLRTAFVAPFPREQTLALTDAMDDIVDLMQDATETLDLYDVRHITPDALRLAEISVRCCQRVQHAVSLLPQLAQPDTKEAALKTCEEIDILESDADRVMRAAMSALFREEPDVRELIKLKAVIEVLEAITDRCEDVAKQIQTIALRHV